MDSRHDYKLSINLKAPSVRKNEQSKLDGNYIPVFGLFNYNPPSSPCSKPWISNSRSGSTSTLSSYIPQATAVPSNSNNPTKSTKQTNETTTEHKLKSLRSTSTGGQKSDESQNKNFDRRTHHESQPFNSTEKNSSTPGDEHPHEAEIRSELNHLTSKFADCQVNLEEVGSISGSDQSSLLPLVRGIRCLCDYLSNLSSVRRQVESKILNKDFILINNCPVVCERGIWNRITDLKKLLSTEISLSLQFISDYKNYLDVERVQCTVNLLNEVARYTEELSAFENLRIFQRNELVHGQGDHIQQLERLLSEISSLLARCVEMFFIMKHYGALGYRRNLRAGTRQYRNIFIG